MGLFVALLRGLNVGGSGLLSMTGTFRDLLRRRVLTCARTYIQSGNVLLDSRLSERDIRLQLEPILKARVGKTVDVMVRTAAEMTSILAGNPFPDENPAQVAVASYTTALYETAATPAIVRE